MELEILVSHVEHPLWVNLDKSECTFISPTAVRSNRTHCFTPPVAERTFSAALGPRKADWLATRSAAGEEKGHRQISMRCFSISALTIL